MKKMRRKRIPFTEIAMQADVDEMKITSRKPLGNATLCSVVVPRKNASIKTPVLAHLFWMLALLGIILFSGSSFDTFALYGIVAVSIYICVINYFSDLDGFFCERTT